jgi:hypothetical protein
MSDVDETVDAAIRESALVPNEIEELPRNEAKHVYDTAKEKFVSGNPRVWWLKLKHKPIVVHTGESPEFSYLERNWPADDSRCYFIPENESDEPRVFDAKLSGIVKLLSNSNFFEYYLVGKDLDWLMIENDHNELLILR